jgi:hypothetical protein
MPTILVADDDPNIVEMLRMTLPTRASASSWPTMVPPRCTRLRDPALT